MKNRYCKLLKLYGVTKAQSDDPYIAMGRYKHIDWEAAKHAGLFTNQDIDEVEKRYQRSIRDSKRREETLPKVAPKRVTIQNASDTDVLNAKHSWFKKGK